MEAQISAGMKTPVLSSRPGPEGSAGEKGRKRESDALSRTQSTERDEQVSGISSETPACCRSTFVPFNVSVSPSLVLFLVL